jgi:hypothetical protein
MMPFKRTKQGVNTKFLVKLKEAATESFMLLCEPYGEDALSRACAYAWYVLQEFFRRNKGPSR